MTVLFIATGGVKVRDLVGRLLLSPGGIIAPRLDEPLWPGFKHAQDVPWLLAQDGIAEWRECLILTGSK